MLEVGRAARELTQHPAYATAMQSMEAFHVSAMVAAQEGPGGSAERDHHHRMLCALRELATDLAARAQAAADLEARLKLAALEDDEEEGL